MRAPRPSSDRRNTLGGWSRKSRRSFQIMSSRFSGTHPLLFQLVENLSYKRVVARSIRAERTMKFKIKTRHIAGNNFGRYRNDPRFKVVSLLLYDKRMNETRVGHPGCLIIDMDISNMKSLMNKYKSILKQRRFDILMKIQREKKKQLEWDWEHKINKFVVRS